MENNKKQTAVDWLVNQLKNNTLPQNHNEFIDGDWKDIIRAAKEMEMMQIIDAIIDTQKEHIVQAECYPPRFIVLKALNYYDENFNK